MAQRKTFAAMPNLCLLPIGSSSAARVSSVCGATACLTDAWRVPQLSICRRERGGTSGAVAWWWAAGAACLALEDDFLVGFWRVHKAQADVNVALPGLLLPFRAHLRGEAREEWRSAGRRSRTVSILGGAAGGRGQRACSASDTL